MSKSFRWGALHLVTNSLIKGEYFMQCVRAQGPVAYINARGSHVQGHVQHHLSLQIFTCPPCSDLLAPLCFTRHCKSYPVCSPHLISRYQFCSLIACLSFDRPNKEKEGEQGKNLIRKRKERNGDQQEEACGELFLLILMLFFLYIEIFFI